MILQVYTYRIIAKTHYDDNNIVINVHDLECPTGHDSLLYYYLVLTWGKLAL